MDWGVNEDFPIFKKYGVMNSGLLDSTRYNKTIFDSLAVVKVCLTKSFEFAVCFTHLSCCKLLSADFGYTVLEAGKFCNCRQMH